MCDMIKELYIKSGTVKVSDFNFIKGSDIMLELTPNLNVNSKKALYVQLYEYIKKRLKMDRLSLLRNYRLSES